MQLQGAMTHMIKKKNKSPYYKMAFTSTHNLPATQKTITAQQKML